MRTENGIVVGTIGNKYSSKNPLARYLVQGFDDAIGTLAAQSDPQSILEIGSGEGHVTEILLKDTRARIHATELSEAVMNETRKQLTDPRVSWELAKLEDYHPSGHFDLVVCCEVLEHLPDPSAGLKSLHAMDADFFVLSVPNEPIWRILNFLRGSYFRDFGNSPGHVQHWSTKQFIQFVSTEFTVLEVRTPLPWTALLCKK